MHIKVESVNGILSVTDVDTKRILDEVVAVEISQDRGKAHLWLGMSEFSCDIRLATPQPPLPPPVGT